MAIQQINLGAEPTGVGGDTNRSAMTKINSNFTDTANAASRLVGTAAGNVMEVGAFGLGSGSRVVTASTADTLTTNGFYHQQDITGTMNYAAFCHIMHGNNNKYAWQLGINMGDANLAGLRARIKKDGEWSSIAKIWNEHNTTIDSDGNLKAASPIVKLFADRIELNDDAKKQPITYEKKGVGNYLIKGSLGFAQEGWYIEMPKDANGNVKVAVVYEQLANNDISIKTYAKKLDPETGDVIANTAKPVDIPAGRWIDLRLHEVKTETTTE